MIIINLIYNISVLLSLSVISGFVENRFSKETLTGKLIQGFLFGIVAIIGMMYPFVLAEGIIFDGRSIVISLATLFFGPITGLIASVIATIYRLHLGGGGALMGILVISSSFLIGLLFHYFSNKKSKSLSKFELYFFGLLVSSVMMILVLTLPSKYVKETYKTITFTILAFYPFITLLIGKFFSDHFENKISIEKIKQNTNLLKTTLYSIGDSVITIDKFGKIINLNHTVEKLTGFKEKELVGTNLNDALLVINEQTQLRINLLRNLENSNFTLKIYEDAILLAKGNIRIPITIIASAIKNDVSEFTGIVFTIRDNTKEREQLRKIEQSEQNFREIFNSTTEGIFIHDSIDGKIIDLNESALKLFGLNEKSDIIGQNVLLVSAGIPPYNEESALKYIESSRLNPVTFEWLAKKLNGYLFYVEVTLRKTTLQNQDRIIAVIRDISERKKAEAKLKESEYMLNKAQKIAKIGSWIWFVQEGKVKWSDEMYRIFEIEKNDDTVDLFEVIQSKIHPDDIEKVNKSNESVVSQKIPIPLEYRIIMNDGTIKIVWAEAGELVEDENGTPIQLSGIVQDITENKKAQLELIAAKELAEENDKLKTAFLQNMSHEIRTPLNGILGFTRLMKDDYTTIEEYREYANIIEASGQRLLQLMNNIMDVSKFESGNHIVRNEKFTLNKLFRDVFDKQIGFSTRNNIELVAVYTDNEISINTDFSKLSKILSNLVNNGIKFSHKGKVIFGFVGIEDKRIFVKDNGIGISPENFEKIFERFYQVDSSLNRGFEGSGLGLSLCKGMAEVLNANIELESEIGIGSTFYIKLPNEMFENKVETKQNLTIKTSLETKKILIAEDDETSFLYLNRILQNHNVEIYSVTNGLEAVDFLKNRHDIDLVLMDIKMPVMNGFEATKLIKQFKPELPIIAQSAYAFESDKVTAKHSGCSDYISKPYEKHALLNCINKFL